jgi:hypothetical protein
MSDAANTEQKQRGRPFVKGTSGNPRGRPEGSRNKATILAQGLLDADVVQLVSKVKQLALEGDPQMLKVWLDRTVAPRREQQVDLTVRNEARVDLSGLSLEELRDLERLILRAAPNLAPADLIEGTQREPDSE